MEYTIKKLGQLAGVSARTLRYYDEIGILLPARINSAGYRIYGQAEVDRLQDILFYRELGVCLDDIKNILDAPGYNRLAALQKHQEKLVDKKKQLDLLIANVEKTIDYLQGRTFNMSDSGKFIGFKKNLINKNELKYGGEIRAKYGDQTVDKANQKILLMKEEQYGEMEKLRQEVNDTLKMAMATGDPAGELGQKTADLHRRWLSFTWAGYPKEAHAGLAQMYVDDERFAAYYDQVGAGAAIFLRDAIFIYTGFMK